MTKLAFPDIGLRNAHYRGKPSLCDPHLLSDSA
jgi:hypothetical protein